MTKFVSTSVITLLCIFTLSTLAIAGQYKALDNYSSNPNFTLVASKKQCLQKCTNWNNECQKLVTAEGNKKNWNQSFRFDAWVLACAPHVSACQTRCGPMGPGECRVMPDGDEICS